MYVQRKQRRLRVAIVA